MRDALRKIIHIDMDAFYAAVEQRDNPTYRHKPIIVGGQPNSRGVVATCSYEARKFGVHSAMPSALAYRLCPQAIFIKPRFAVYQQASDIIRQIFQQYAEIFEPLSLDEAYLEVSNSEWFQGSATLLAKHIKQEIRRQTGLVASAGISYNKFLAKIASDHSKPDGLLLITPEQGPKFVETLAIKHFHGIGPVTEKKMRELGIFTGKDLKDMPLPQLQQHFGKSARYYFDLARGIDLRPVISQRIRKSIGIETTFAEDIGDRQLIEQNLTTLLQKALDKLQEKHMEAHTLTLKIKYQNFVQITRSKTLPFAINRYHDANPLIVDLLQNTEIDQKKVRLLGITLSGLHNPGSIHAPYQTDLFDID